MENLKPFFTYFGGKYRLAPRYPKPRWATIIEPFAGSAGYSVRYHNRKVILYDLNPKVVGTWDYLIRASTRDILSLPLVFDDVRDLSVCQEAKWLIGWWLNKGTASPCHKPSVWMRSGIRPNSYWGEVVRSRVAEQAGLIRHWQIHQDSYASLPTNQRATWFVDPPYQRSGSHYVHSKVDYAHLSSWTTELHGQVIACGQEGDDWVEFRPFHTAKSTPGYKTVGTSKEVIWTNP